MHAIAAPTHLYPHLISGNPLETLRSTLTSLTTVAKRANPRTLPHTHKQTKQTEKHRNTTNQHLIQLLVKHIHTQYTQSSTHGRSAPRRRAASTSPSCWTPSLGTQRTAQRSPASPLLTILALLLLSLLLLSLEPLLIRNTTYYSYVYSCFYSPAQPGVALQPAYVNYRLH